MKIEKIQFRVSKEEKEKYCKYANKLNMTISEFIRLACEAKIKEIENGKSNVQ